MLQAGHEAVGAQVTVLRKVDRSGHSHCDGRVQSRGLPGIEHIGRDAQRAGLGRGMGFLVEGVLAAAQHEQAFFHKAEVELG